MMIMKLIDKDALVAEVERRLEEYRTYPDYQMDSNYMELCDILSFLDTLEVKEVDLEKEYTDFVEEDPVYSKLVNSIVGKAITKHFFELGMQVSNKAQNIWHDANEKLPTGVIVVNNGGHLHIGWSTDEGDGIEDEHGRLITKTYQKWAREEDLTTRTDIDAFAEKAKKWFEEHFESRLKWEIATYEFKDMQNMVENFRKAMED